MFQVGDKVVLSPDAGDELDALYGPLEPYEVGEVVAVDPAEMVNPFLQPGALPVLHLTVATYSVDRPQSNLRLTRANSCRAQLDHRTPHHRLLSVLIHLIIRLGLVPACRGFSHCYASVIQWDPPVPWPLCRACFKLEIK